MLIHFAKKAISVLFIELVGLKMKHGLYLFIAATLYSKKPADYTSIDSFMPNTSFNFEKSICLKNKKYKKRGQKTRFLQLHQLLCLFQVKIRLTSYGFSLSRSYFYFE